MRPREEWRLGAGPGWLGRPFRQLGGGAEALANEMKTAKIGEPMAYTDAMKTYVGQQISSAMRGDISAKDALDRAVKYCNDHAAK